VHHCHFVGHLDERPEGCQQRPRRCLLKGCERLFWPCRPQTRYCNEACRQKAQRWRRWQASQRYRASEQGRQRRRHQSQRYRQRQRERQSAAADTQTPPEGQRPALISTDFSTRPCHRPGCYELFTIRHDQSCRRFCSLACRQALRRVLDREARYRARRRRWRRQRLTRRVRPPNTS
jgi:hypothetical protein